MIRTRECPSGETCYAEECMEAMQCMHRDEALAATDEQQDMSRILLRTIMAEAERTGSWTVPADIQERIKELFR